MEMIGNMEASPWQFGYASLGSQLVLAKRVTSPPALAFPPAKDRDLDTEAVMNVPPTPAEAVGLVPATPALPRSLAPPVLSAPVLLRQDGD
jgi:hypothetical protein